jgi:hypothetical protein
MEGMTMISHPINGFIGELVFWGLLLLMVLAIYGGCLLLENLTAFMRRVARRCGWLYRGMTVKTYGTYGLDYPVMQIDKDLRNLNHNNYLRRQAGR